MARAPILDDDDDEDGAVERLISPDVGNPGAKPMPPEPVDRGDGAADDDWDVIETDENGNPLNQQKAEPQTDEEDGEEEEERPQRRDPHSARRARRKEARERDEREREALRAQNAELMRRLEGLESQVGGITPRLQEYDSAQRQGRLADLQRQMDTAARELIDAETAMADAMAGADPEAYRAALAKQRDAIRRGDQLERQKEALERMPAATPADDQKRQPTRREAVQPPPPMDRAVRERTLDFQSRFPWIGKRGGDDEIDSEIALRLDNSVAADGYDPRDDDYWSELERRMRRAPQLAHRFASGQDSRARSSDRDTPSPRRPDPGAARRGPPAAGASGGTRPAGQQSRNSVTLTPERRNAMIALGAMDNSGRVIDREKFNTYAKSYAQWDRDNASAPR